MNVERLEDDTLPVRILADAREGEISKFAGKVVAPEGELLTSPITGRRCVCFDAAVFALRQEAATWNFVTTSTLVRRVLRGTSFTIDDGTGRAVVDPRGAYVRLVHDHYQGGLGQRWNVRVADPTFLADDPAPGELELGEGVLEVGESVVVIGLVRRAVAADPESGLYRVSADARTYITGAADRPADISDRRGDLKRAGIEWPRQAGA
jgi:hypothetical protein